MKVGILGGGQLGQMLALAGLPLGLRFRFLEPADESPAGQVAERIIGSFEDADCLDRFAEGLDVVTYEFENVPTASARRLAQRVPVYPPPAALEVSQDRLAEKQLFGRLNIPTTQYATVDSRADLDQAVARLKVPAVLKTRRLGYDGKGQVVIRYESELGGAWDELGGVPLILEQFIDFDRELSIIAARSRDGEIVFYPMVENEHEEGILSCSFAPAEVSETKTRAARDYVRRLMSSFDYVGVLALEIGATQSERLLALARMCFRDGEVCVIKDLAGLDRVLVVRTGGR